RAGGPAPDYRQQAEARVAAGSDWVTIYGSRGSYQSVDTTQTLTFDEMKAAVDAAHAKNHRVAIHSYGPSGVKDAVRAGADSIEHGIDLDEERSPTWRGAAPCGCRRSITTAITSRRKTSSASLPTRFRRSGPTSRRTSNPLAARSGPA